MHATPKLLHVVISMSVGGAERLVYDMVRNARFVDNKPVVCCLDSLGDLGQHLSEQGYAVHVANRKAGLDWHIVGWLKNIMRREGIDVVHAHQYTPLFYAVPASFLADRTKLVYTEHGRFHPDRRSWKRFCTNPILARGIDHLVSISAATARAMAAFDNLPSRRIKVIHNGIDCSRMNPVFDIPEKRRELGLEDECRIVGTAARLNSIKNIQMMIRSLRLVLDKEPATCLVIAGQGEEEARLRSLAAELGVAERVRFIGLRFDLPEIYPLFDVFLLTSFSEGISVTLLEAMASGVPAVVTNVGGNPEVVVEGVTGYLVDVDDDRLFARRLCDLLGDHSLAEQMGWAARKRVDDCFSLEGMLDAYCRLYG